jgi:hypothetical protein
MAGCGSTPIRLAMANRMEGNETVKTETGVEKTGSGQNLTGHPQFYRRHWFRLFPVTCFELSATGVLSAEVSIA